MEPSFAETDAPGRPVTLGTVRAPSWNAFNMSLTGASHSRRNSTCQDASACELIGRDAVALIVADGAGHHSNINSSWASKTAVECAVTHLRDSALTLERGSVENRLSAFRQLFSDIEISYLGRVRQDSYRLNQSLTTLAVAYVSDDLVLYGGIGDSFLLTWDRSGRAFLPVPIKRVGQVSNETVFLSQSQTEQNGFVYAILDPDCRAVALSTDGLIDVFLDYTTHDGGAVSSEPRRLIKGRLDPVILAMQSPAASIASVGTRLAQLLQESWVSDYSEDDLTLAIATRTGDARG